MGTKWFCRGRDFSSQLYGCFGGCEMNQVAIKLIENQDQEYSIQTRETVMWTALLMDC